jgi:hypothetical protein
MTKEVLLHGWCIAIIGLNLPMDDQLIGPASAASQNSFQKNID